MEAVEPSPQQYRMAAFALVLIAALTAVLISVVWVDALNEPLRLPLLAAYLLFNFGFVFAAVKGRFQSKAARLGLVAVSLNLAALVLGEPMWTALSAGAVTLSTAAAYMLFRESKAAKV